MERRQGEETGRERRRRRDLLVGYGWRSTCAAMMVCRLRVKRNGMG